MRAGPGGARLGFRQLVGSQQHGQSTAAAMPAAAQTAVTTLRFAGEEGAQRRCRRRFFGTRPTGRTSKGPDAQVPLSRTSTPISDASVPLSLPAGAAPHYYGTGRPRNRPGAAHNHCQLSKPSLRCQVGQGGDISDWYMHELAGIATQYMPIRVPASVRSSSERRPHSYTVSTVATRHSFRRCHDSVCDSLTGQGVVLPHTSES